MKTAPHILVLDDEPMILLDLSIALRSAGCEPVTARSMTKALRIAEEGRIDGAILDVNLGGGVTCEPVAETLTERGVPFVLHSGDLDRQGELIGRLGAPIVPKPAPGAKVVAAIEGLLCGQEAERMVSGG